MNNEYYILNGTNTVGPYDLVMLVRKIRNGSLTSEMLIRSGNDAIPKPATEWPELAEFFQEYKEDLSQSHHHIRDKSLLMALSSGWRFFLRNQPAIIISAMLVLIIILMTALSHFVIPANFRVLGYVISLIFGHFLLSCYMLSILRMVRGQPTDLAYIQKKVAPAITELLLSSLVISFLASLGLVIVMSSNNPIWSFIGLLILAVPGMFIITLYAFAPLLILDQGYAFWDAMETSRKAVLKNGMENAGILYALFVINFLAGLFALLPMMLSLPVTMSSVTEIYDEMFG